MKSDLKKSEVFIELFGMNGVIVYDRGNGYSIDAGMDVRRVVLGRFDVSEISEEVVNKKEAGDDSGWYKVFIFHYVSSRKRGGDDIDSIGELEWRWIGECFFEGSLLGLAKRGVDFL